MPRRAHKIGQPVPRQGGFGADVSREFEQLAEIVGRGAPLDSMARARALGIVALLERVLTNGAAQRTLEQLRELVGGHDSGRDAARSERGTKLIAALDDVRGAIYDVRGDEEREERQDLRRREELVETH